MKAELVPICTTWILGVVLVVLLLCLGPSAGKNTGHVAHPFPRAARASGIDHNVPKFS